ncbi:glycosyltransferase [Algoriphagus yeomjeoni]|uniref:glycosyltransferase n=1 Tax=Algoriphagus yeomjeoni TaxID=291403 RepID=UPI003CE49AE1
MKILYCHVGVQGKNGWGRSFYLACGLAELNHDVYFLTATSKKGLFNKTSQFINKVHVLAFADILPYRLVSTGFGFISVLSKIFFAISNKFDLVITDCGHRPSSLPGFLAAKRKNTIHITEWWDLFGEGGYYDRKPWYFKYSYGWFEKKLEIITKKKANGVVVLSEWMRSEAIKHGIEKIKIIHGGCFEKKKPVNNDSNFSKKINIGYIGMSNSELEFIEPIIDAFKTNKIKDLFNFICFGEYLNIENLNKNDLNNDFFQERGWLNYEQSLDEITDINLFLMIRRPDRNALAGWPNKLGDYLSFGKPVLINIYGDISTFVKNNPEGFIVTEFNGDSLVNCLFRIFNGDFDLSEMGKKNFELSKKLTWKDKALELVDFYNQLQQ